MLHRTIAATGLLLSTFTALSPQTARDTKPPPASELVVSAGPLDRRHTLVAFNLPEVTGPLVLRDAAGTRLHLQVEADGRAWFVLPDLKAGTQRAYRLEPVTPGTPAGAMVAAMRGDVIDFTWEGRPVVSYQGGPGTLPAADIKPIFQRGGYLHPVRTPSGRIVTDDYPEDHRHHHGIWFAWTKTQFEGREPDFWNVGDGKGRVEFEAIERTWNGPVHAGVRAKHRYVDLTSGSPKVVLSELWETRVFAVGRAPRPYFLFDVDVQQTATAAPLHLPEYHYGGIGVRGAREFHGAANAAFLSSEGKDRSNGHATRARWCHMSGRVNAQIAGLAILGHPSNVRAPEPMRIHPTDPFFCYAPSQLGAWQIAPGTPHSARYRFIVFDGPADPREIDRIWNDYAHPPAVTVTQGPRG